MKKVLLSLLIVLISVGAFAQNMGNVAAGDGNVAVAVAGNGGEAANEADTPNEASNTNKAGTLNEAGNSNKADAANEADTPNESKADETTIETESDITQVEAAELETEAADTTDAADANDAPEDVTTSPEDLTEALEEPPVLSEYEQLLALTKFKESSYADEQIIEIENLKTKLNNLRVQTKNEINDFNLNQNIATQQRIAEINAEPWKTVDLYEDYPTREALKRRENSINEVKEEAEKTKAQFAAEKNSQLAASEKVLLPKITAAYKNLEKQTFRLNSIDHEVYVSVDTFNGEDSSWKVHISADILEHEDIYENSISLSYTELTGKKIKELSKLSAQELEDYNNEVEKYNQLFETEEYDFYVQLEYQILRWNDASQYHFVPVKCDVIRLGSKSKVIKSVEKKDFRPAEFVQEPAVEYRSEEEIKEDLIRSNKTLIEERKVQGFYSATKKSKYSTSTTKTKLQAYKKRNAFIISGDYFNTNISDDKMINPTALDVQASLTLSPLNHTYIGMSGGVMKWNAVQNNDKVGQAIYFAKLHPGISFPLGSYVRLYGEGGFEILASPYNFNDYNAKYKTNLEELKPGNDFCMGLFAGAGADIIFVRPFMITLGVNYNWMHYAKSIAVVKANNEGIMTAFTNPDFQYLDFSIGVGITWQ